MTLNTLNQNYLALIALLVSLVALLTTVLQFVPGLCLQWLTQFNCANHSPGSYNSITQVRRGIGDVILPLWASGRVERLED
jgi:hypothetical protein